LIDCNLLSINDLKKRYLELTIMQISAIFTLQFNIEAMEQLILRHQLPFGYLLTQILSTWPVGKVV
jgi:hypothetical protein